MMKLLQLYYTSAKRGISSTSGFQVYAASEDLTADEIYELEEICLYIAPTHLPSQPSEAEIDELFPVSFASFQLESGRYGVVQSVYVGKDYSGRYGNYFSHALILEEGKWPFPPISLYNSPIFRKNLTEIEQAIEREPEPLIPLSLIEPKTGITLSNVQQFLQVDNRYELLKTMVNNVIELRNMPSSVVLAAEEVDIPYWIAAIQFAFPPEIGHALSFSTYSYDPEQDRYTIAVTLDEGTRFSFERELNRTDLYAINLLTNEYNEAAESYRYTDYVIDKELQLTSLFAAFSGFTLKSPSAALDSFMDYFDLFYNEQAEVIDSETAIQNALQFMEQYGTEEKASKMVEQVNISQLLKQDLSLEMAGIIARSLTDIYKQSKRDEHGVKIANFLLDISNHFIEREQPLADLERFLFNHLDKLHAAEAVYGTLLTVESLQGIKSIVSAKQEVDIQLFYAKLIIKIMVEAHLSWDSLDEEQGKYVSDIYEPIFLQAELDDDTKRIFAPHPALFAHLSIAMDIKQQDERLSDLFSKNFVEIFAANDHDEKWLTDVHDVLQESSNGKVLLSFYYAEQLKQSDSIVAMTDILAHAVQFKVGNVERLLDTFLQALNDSGRQNDHLKQVAYVLKNKTLYALLEEEAMIDNLLQTSQRSIDFSDQAVQADEKSLLILSAQMRDLKHETSLYELALVTYEVKQEKRKDFALLEKVLLANLGAKNKLYLKEKLPAYISWAFPELLTLIYEQKKASPLAKELIHAYADMILDTVTSRREKVKTKHFHLFLIDLFHGLCASGFTDDKMDSFANYLGQQEADVKKLNHYFQKQTKHQAEWDKIYDKVQAQKGNNIVSSIKSLFRSKK